MSKASANFGGTVGWDDQTVIGKRAPRSSDLKTESAIAAAQRDGVAIETAKKYAAGHNKQHEAAKNTAILDRETEELHHDRVEKDVARAIQQARIAKEWTQADLARHINEKQQVVNEYEQSKAIPNQQVLSKMERALGVKLRGKDVGQPLSTGPKKK
nr:EOG090X0ILG [Ilyocryptus agilis]